MIILPDGNAVLASEIVMVSAFDGWPESKVECCSLLYTVIGRKPHVVLQLRSKQHFYCEVETLEEAKLERDRIISVINGLSI